MGLEIIDQYLAIEPDRPEVLFQRGWLLLKTAGDRREKIHEAIKAFQQAKQVTVGAIPAVCIRLWPNPTTAWTVPV